MDVRIGSLAAGLLLAAAAEALLPPSPRSVVTWDADGALVWPDEGVRALARASGLFSPGTAVVWSVAFGAGRAFVCMPRWSPGVAATLVSAQWPPLGPRPPLRPFPSWPAQYQGRCDNLQSAVAARVDRLSRLWILDEGSIGCPPKFLVFDQLRLRPSEVARHVVRAPGLLGPLRHMVLDGYVAYASSSGPALLVYSLREHSSWVVRAMRAVGPIAISGPRLYFTPRDGSSELLALHLSRLRYSPAAWNSSSPPFAEVEAVGSLLGPSSGLSADPSGTLVYFLQRDHAVVSWDARRGHPCAETHRVILQDDRLLPRVRQIALDPQGVFWAVAVGFNASGTCIRLHRARPRATMGLPTSLVGEPWTPVSPW